MIIFLGNSHSLSLYKDIIEDSKNCSPDIVVSCQYPHRVPSSLLKSHTCVNIHYGELPQYAGCNPIYWQIMTNDHAGVTLHYMDDNFDSGDIIAQKIMPISNLTADEVYEGLAYFGKELFKKNLKGILDGTAPRKKQDLSLRKYFNKDLVDFKKEKYCDLNDTRKIRAVHFEGKQKPIVNIGGLHFEVSRSYASL